MNSVALAMKVQEDRMEVTRSITDFTHGYSLEATRPTEDDIAALRDGDELRTVAVGPDPISTMILALVWGVGGGAAVSVLASLRGRVNRRA